MGHVHRQARFLSGDGTPAGPRIQEVRGALLGRLQITRVFLSGSVLMHEFRAIDFSGELARHRSLPAFRAREALPDRKSVV